MIRSWLKPVRRFRDEDRGNVTVEFMILFPVFMFITLSAIELGIVSLNHVMLEQALDRTVRDIRLGTGTTFDHNEVKDTICERAVFINDCDSNLKLELIPQDPRVALVVDPAADCVDKREEIEPRYNFTNGQSNQLMVMRACVKIAPIFPSTGIGHSLADNPEGLFALTATTAFVQEPS